MFYDDRIQIAEMKNEFIWRHFPSVDLSPQLSRVYDPTKFPNSKSSMSNVCDLNSSHDMCFSNLSLFLFFDFHLRFSIGWSFILVFRRWIVRVIYYNRFMFRWFRTRTFRSGRISRFIYPLIFRSNFTKTINFLRFSYKAYVILHFDFGYIIKYIFCIKYKDIWCKMTYDAVAKYNLTKLHSFSSNTHNLFEYHKFPFQNHILERFRIRFE